MQIATLGPGGTGPFRDMLMAERSSPLPPPGAEAAGAARLPSVLPLPVSPARCGPTARSPRHGRGRCPAGAAGAAARRRPRSPPRPGRGGEGVQPPPPGGCWDLEEGPGAA